MIVRDSYLMSSWR